MKTIASKELRYRLANAAANGSVIARDILAELKKNVEVSDIIRGCANYFSTKRKKQECSGYQKVKIVFTACTKDTTHPNFPDRDNPQAPWFSENRIEVDASTFTRYFKNLPDYSPEEIDYFNNAICVNSKVSVKLYDRMSDFYDAYLGENYTGTAQFGDSSLHNSCMKSEGTSRNAADFYYNFAGAKIIIARDAGKNILGRAIVWENVIHTGNSNGADDGVGNGNGNKTEVNISVLDRVYFSHTFINKLICDYAQNTGIHLRKKRNEHSCTGEFVALNDVQGLGIAKGDNFTCSSLMVRVPATRWHKKGAPYLDTFYGVCLSEDGGIFLKNTEDSHCFATCRQTDGFACNKYNVCPVCGCVHRLDDHLCGGCHEKYCVETPFGMSFAGKTVTYRGSSYPGFLFRKGRPNRNLNRYLQIQKLYEQ